MPDHKLFLQENRYLFQEMFRIFQVRKMPGFRDHSGFNGRIQLLVFLCDKRSRSFFFSGNNIDACVRRFYGIINADIQVFANVAGIQIFGVGTGETFSGEYAVIINTDTTNPGNTGTLQFDGTSAQAADSEAEDYAVVQGGSNASAQAATEGTAGEAADVGQVQSLEDDQLQAYMQDDQPMLTAVQAAATTYQVGEKKYIYRTNGHDTYGKTYVCIGVGEHCYVWMDETLKADYDTAGKTALIAAVS